MKFKFTSKSAKKLCDNFYDHKYYKCALNWCINSIVESAKEGGSSITTSLKADGRKEIAIDKVIDELIKRGFVVRENTPRDSNYIYLEITW